MDNEVLFLGGKLIFSEYYEFENDKKETIKVPAAIKCAGATNFPIKFPVQALRALIAEKEKNPVEFEKHLKLMEQGKNPVKTN